MNSVTRSAVVGMDVGRDWLDIHCLPSNQRLGVPTNTDEEHARVSEMALS